LCLAGMQDGVWYIYPKLVKGYFAPSAITCAILKESMTIARMQYSQFGSGSAVTVVAFAVVVARLSVVAHVAAEVVTLRFEDRHSPSVKAVAVDQTC